MEPGICVSEMLDLQMLNRREHHGGNEIYIVADIRERFEGIEKRRAAGAHEPRGLAGNNSAVGKLDGDGGVSSLLGLGSRCRDGFAH